MFNQCPHCPLSFSHAEDLREHKVLAHPAPMPIATNKDFGAFLDEVLGDAWLAGNEYALSKGGLEKLRTQNNKDSKVMAEAKSRITAEHERIKQEKYKEGYDRGRNDARYGNS